MEHTLYVVGIYPGNPDYVVPKGIETIKKATVLVGSERALEDFRAPGQTTYAITGKLSILAEQIQQELVSHDVVVMVSGDTGYYSLLPYLKKKFPNQPIEVIAGISSMTFAFARLGEVWHDADLMSAFTDANQVQNNWRIGRARKWDSSRIQSTIRHILLVYYVKADGQPQRRLQPWSDSATTMNTSFVAPSNPCKT